MENDWKEIALYLVECLAANVEGLKVEVNFTNWTIEVTETK